MSAATVAPAGPTVIVSHAASVPPAFPVAFAVPVAFVPSVAMAFITIHVTWIITVMALI